MAAPTETVPDYFWRSLRFFCFYRLAVGLLFLAAALYYGDVLNLGAQDLRLFIRTTALYLLAAVAFIGLIYRAKIAFATQLLVQVLADVGFLTVMMYSSGGQKSGLAVLLLIVIAGAGLVGQGRMTLFFAAVASVAMLLEQGLQTLKLNADSGDFFRTGLVCVGFFGMAVTARLLARRVVANEELAQSRGRELAKQLAVSNRIISDMADGVLVLDSRGIVRQSNPTADRMLNVQVGSSTLRDWAPHLARQMHLGTGEPAEQFEVIRLAGGQTLRLRLLLPSSSGGDPVVYVEDMERVEKQAQQLKLAALGRLTANIAHEIRNPLAAILHAAELLAEDEPDAQRLRLATIVANNSTRLNRLVTEVLELGRRDRATRERLEWQAFSQSFHDEFVLHDPTAAFRVLMESTNAAFMFDRGHLHRVLWNLLVNALRHASAGQGAVRVFIVAGGGRQLMLNIIDDGPGISQTLRGQIFEPFVTSHGSGTGLGLYIARELCEANGATLQLVDDGVPQTGAHFRISLEAA